jgi:transcriptional regulator with XRE-family HTH domain
MDTPHLGRSIQAAQKKHGITSSELARKLGVSRQNFHHLRNQKDIYTSRTLELLRVFNMELNEFIELGEQ